MIQPFLHHFVKRFEPRAVITAHPLHVDAHDQLEVGKGTFVRFGIQHLVDLFLIPANDDAALGMPQDIVEFAPGIGRIDPDGHATQRLRSDVGIQPFRRVFAGDGQTIAAPEPPDVEAQGEAPHFGKIFGPGDPVPDPEVLFPDRQFIRNSNGPVQQQLRKGDIAVPKALVQIVHQPAPNASSSLCPR
nr:hypothetical protein [Mesorhizobium sp. J428]